MMMMFRPIRSPKMSATTIGSNALFQRPIIFMAIILAVLPVALPNLYTLDVAIRAGFTAIVVIGLNMLMGFAGQISIGHAAFVAIGAYGSGILTARYAWNPLAAMAAAACLSASVAYLFGKPVLRLKGHALTLATLGLGLVVNIGLTNQVSLTGGPDGMAVPPFQLGNWQLVDEYQWYAVAATLLVLVAGFSLNLQSSAAGRALRGLHSAEVAARVMGVDAGAFKVRIFVVSAIIASIGGSLTAHYLGFISPNQASFTSSMELTTMVVVGGMGSTFGSVVGAVLLTVLPQLLGGLPGWEMLLFGMILVLTMIFLPAGLVPTLAARLGRRRATDA